MTVSRVGGRPPCGPGSWSSESTEREFKAPQLSAAEFASLLSLPGVADKGHGCVGQWRQTSPSPLATASLHLLEAVRLFSAAAVTGIRWNWEEDLFIFASIYTGHCGFDDNIWPFCLFFPS